MIYWQRETWIVLTHFINFVRLLLQTIWIRIIYIILSENPTTGHFQIFTIAMIAYNRLNWIIGARCPFIAFSMNLLAELMTIYNTRWVIYHQYSVQNLRNIVETREIAKISSGVNPVWSRQNVISIMGLNYCSE